MCATSRLGFTWLYLPACSLSSLTSLRATGSESSRYPRTRIRLYAKAFPVVLLPPFSTYIHTHITLLLIPLLHFHFRFILFFVHHVLPFLFFSRAYFSAVSFVPIGYWCTSCILEETIAFYLAPNIRNSDVNDDGTSVSEF